LRYLRNTLPYILAVAIAISGYVGIHNEINVRSDQTCFLFESDHLADVVTLRETYKYIEALKPGERSATINKFILVNLPSQEREARADLAPTYCDTMDLGLPEPDPVIPKRPAKVQALLNHVKHP
jgi:hypothetical protein